MTTTIIAGSLFLITLIILIVVLFKRKTPDSINNKYANLVKYSEEGGMAIIYKAFNKESKRWCILKVLRQKQIHDREAVESLYKEADILIKIKEILPEANVPAVYDKGEIQDKFSKLPFIELEYIKGKTSLEDYLKKNGKLSVEEADKLIAKLLPSIKASHKLRFIHRDIKPSNILLRDGKIDQPVLIDFGIAKEEGGKKTETGLFLAPKYMAPEQADPDRPDLTVYVDNYILGILWYELLAGDVPFFSKNPLKMAEMHRTRDIKPFVENSIPEDRQKIIAGLLEKEPSDRPSIDEVANLLDQSISFKSEVSSDKVVHKKQKKHSNLVIILLIVALLITGGATFYLYQTGRLENIKNVTINKVAFNFTNFNAKVVKINPVKSSEDHYLEYKNFQQFYTQLQALDSVDRLCSIISNKINKNDPNRTFFIVDPNNLEIEDNFFISKTVLIVNLKKNSIQLKSNYKLALFYKNAIFAIKKSIIQD